MIGESQSSETRAHGFGVLLILKSILQGKPLFGFSDPSPKISPYFTSGFATGASLMCQSLFVLRFCAGLSIRSTGTPQLPPDVPYQHSIYAGRLGSTGPPPPRRGFRSAEIALGLHSSSPSHILLQISSPEPAAPTTEGTRRPVPKYRACRTGSSNSARGEDRTCCLTPHQRK